MPVDGGGYGPATVGPPIRGLPMRMNKPPRRFPPPWSVQKTEGSHFKISDANGFALAYVYVKDNRAGGYDGLTEDEARRIAVNIARLPELLLRKS